MNGSLRQGPKAVITKIRHEPGTHGLTALLVAILSVLATLYIAGKRNARGLQTPRVTEAELRLAKEKLSSSLKIRFRRADSPTADSQALAILQARDEAHVIATSTSSTAAERDAARAIEEMRTRQLVAEASAHPGVKILNGHAAPPNSFQFQVAVVYSVADSPAYGLHCAGSLIDPSWVVTAAHCFNEDSQNDDFQIFTGSRKLSEGGRLVPIAKIIRNDYDPSTNERDIALVKLATPVTDQQSIDLADSAAETTQTGHMATISGWGVTAEGSRIASDDLLFAYVPLVKNSVCKAAYEQLPPEDRKEIKDDMICAGEGKADTCQGDSGGPLTIRTTDRKTRLEGVVSWGEGCNRAKFPGVYARVPTYVSWIRSRMQSE